MKFCLPIESDNGFKSPVAEHFGTAPLFVIIDTETRKHTVVPNADIGHAEGGCDPFRAIGGEQIDIIITGSLGGGALQKLNTAGIVVYKAEGATVMENLNLLADSCLHEFVLAEGASAGQGSCCPHWTMGRAKKPRTCSCPFESMRHRIFKPAGTPTTQLERISLFDDELESMRLCDVGGLTQAEAGRMMGISRGTVQRLLTSGRNKMVSALLESKALFVGPEHEEH